MPTDVGARRRSLRVRHRCARCSRRGGRTRHAAALERSTPPSRRKLLAGVTPTPYTTTRRDYARRGVSRVERLRIARTRSRPRCSLSAGCAYGTPWCPGALDARAGRTREWRERSKRTTTCSRRAGGRAHTLVGCVIRRFAGIEPSSARAADDASKSVEAIPLATRAPLRSRLRRTPRVALRSRSRSRPPLVFLRPPATPPPQPWRRSSSSAAAAIRAP